MSVPNGLIATLGSPTRIDSFDGFSSTILDTFSTAAQNKGMSWDGTDLISTLFFFAAVISKRVGFSSTIKENLVTTSIDADPRGASWDGKNLISGGIENKDCYLHDGFSVTVTDTIDAPAGPADLTWHRPTGDLVVCDGSTGGTNTVIMFDGFSDTQIDSIDPTGNPTGIGSQGVNYVHATILSNRFLLLEGFTTTILDFFGTASGAPLGCTWGLRYTEGTRRERQSKAHHRSTQRRRH